MNQIQYEKIDFGKIDARHETLYGDQRDKQYFESVFIPPSGIDCNQYLLGKKFFVLGLKGTGKSALLRYIQIRAESDLNAITRFILFRSSFKKGEISKYQEINNKVEESHSVIIDDSINPSETGDFVSVWKFFLHSQIFDLVSVRPQFIQGDMKTSKYYDQMQSSRSSTFIDTIKFLATSVKIKSLEISNNPKLLLDIDWSDKETKFNLDKKIAEIEASVFELEFDKNAHIFIFVDEIELSVKDTKKYNRDLCLVRDLILVSNEYNEIFRKNDIPIRIISAIRMEIIDQVYLLGDEIDKILIDFSDTLRWHDAVYNYDIHPLLGMACKRIQSHYTGLNLSTQNISDICKKYIFGIQGDQVSREEFVNIQRRFLDKTWYRPRDIVNYFNLAKIKCENFLLEYKATKSVNKEFSRRLWRDLEEGLSAKYTTQEIQAVGQILNGFKHIFTFNEFMERVDELSDIYDEVAILTEKKKAANILSDLFTVGAVGNLHKGNVRYSFRGDASIIIDKSTNFIVHQSLVPRFGMLERFVEKKS